MQSNWKKHTASLLAGIIMIGSLSTTAFASSLPINEHSLIISTRLLTSEVSNSEISEEALNKMVQEILNEKYDYSTSRITTRSIVTRGLSKGTKTALLFIRKNLPKIQNIIKTYTGVAIKTKATTQYIDQILNGVVAIDDSIDGAIYAVVDWVAPELNPQIKRIIANAIRLISPV